MLRKIKRIARKIYEDVCHPIIGVVYTLHRVQPKETNRLSYFDNLSVTPEYLYNFVIYKQKKYDFIKLSELPERLSKRNKKGEKPFALLTFDDGYADNYNYAYPILKQTKTPFAIFLTCNFIDNRQPFNFPFLLERIIYNNDLLVVNGEKYVCSDMEQKNEIYKLLEKEMLTWAYEDVETKFKTFFCDYLNENVYEDNMLTWQQVNEMKNSRLCEFGAHTMTHCRLSNMSENELLYELGESKRLIEKQIGIFVDCISYPFGTQKDYNDLVLDIGEQLGYRFGFQLNGKEIRYNQFNSLCLNRVNVFDGYERYF